METNVKDQVSRGVIRGWLENYQALIAEDKSIDAVPRNSGFKPNDGVSNSVLNRIVLTEGLKYMRWEAKRLYDCCKARWIDQDEVRFTLERLGLTNYKYYKFCDMAVDYLYFKINGKDIDRNLLLNKFRKLYLS